MLVRSSSTSPFLLEGKVFNWPCKLASPRKVWSQRQTELSDTPQLSVFEHWLAESNRHAKRPPLTSAIEFKHLPLFPAWPTRCYSILDRSRELSSHRLRIVPEAACVERLTTANMEGRD